MNHPAAQPTMPVVTLDLDVPHTYRTWAEVPNIIKRQFQYKGALDDRHGSRLVWFHEWHHAGPTLELDLCLIDTSKRLDGIIYGPLLTFQPKLFAAGQFTLIATLYIDEQRRPQ